MNKKEKKKTDKELYELAEQTAKFYRKIEKEKDSNGSYRCKDPHEIIIPINKLIIKIGKRKFAQLKSDIEILKYNKKKNLIHLRIFNKYEYWFKNNKWVRKTLNLEIDMKQQIKEIDVSDKLEEYINSYNILKNRNDKDVKNVNLEDFIVPWGNFWGFRLYEPTLEKDIFVGLKCILYGNVDDKIININAEVSYIQEPNYNYDEITEDIMIEDICGATDFLKTKSCDNNYIKKLKNKALKTLSKDKKRQEFIKMTLSSYSIDFNLIDCDILILENKQN